MKTVRLLLNDDMARAVVEGRKTVTRRPVVPQPAKRVHTLVEGRLGLWLGLTGRAGVVHAGDEWTAPGAPGDLLIGRECWGYRGTHSCSDDGFKARTHYVRYRADGSRLEFRRDDDSGLPKQRNQRDDETDDEYSTYLSRYWQAWTPSIHMPNWAARIRRRVVSVTVERLQDITEDDAVLEGFPGSDNEGEDCPARSAFADAWDAIYMPKRLDWIENPWVWRIEFRAENVGPTP